MVKKDGFRDVWFKNRSISGCKSRKRIWNDKYIPLIEFSHNNKCKTKMERKALANQANPVTEKNEQDQFEKVTKVNELNDMTERRNCTVTKTTNNKEIDFKLGYTYQITKDKEF